MSNPLEQGHAYAELGGLLKERFGLLLTVDQCREWVDAIRAGRPDPCKPCTGTGRPPRVHAAEGMTKCPHCAGTGLGLAS